MSKELIGQEQLFSDVRVSPKHEDMKAKRAFGAIVTPEYWGINPADYSEIPESWVEAVAPRALRGDLMPGRNTDGNLVVDGIALTPGEYELIPRNVEKFGNAVVAKAMKGKLQFRPAEERQERAEMAKKEALENKRLLIQTYLTDGLQQQADVLLRLYRASQAPGYWRMSEANMWQSATYVRSIFSSMLDTVGIQREWTEEQKRQAEASLNKRLLLTGKNRVGNWKQWLLFARTYNTEKQKIFESRLEKIS